MTITPNNAPLNSCMSRRSLGSAIIILCFSVRIFALDPTRLITQYGHNAWRLQDGIFPGAPTAITQTKDGYIWVGTQSGLLRFDGVRFVSWEPPAGQTVPRSSSTIVSLLGARDGSLWIGTNVGLSHWTNNRLIKYPGASANVNSILEDHNGTIWFTRSRIRDWSGPLCRVVGPELRCYGTKDGIAAMAADSIVEDKKGYLWVGATGALIRWKDDRATVYPLRGSNPTDGMQLINGVVITQEDRGLIGVLSGGPGRGLQQLQGNGWKPLTKPGLNGSNIEVLTMLEDRNGDVWVGTTNNGVYRIHGEVVEHFGRADGLSGDTVEDFFQDREGNLWVATTDGLDLFHDLRIANFGVREGLASGVTPSVLARDDGSVWAGSQGGLNYLPQGNASFDSIRKDLPGRQLKALFEDRAGNLWVGVDAGIYIYRDRRFVPVLEANPAIDVISFAEDFNNDIWAVLAGPKPALLRIHDFRVREEVPYSKVSAAFTLVADPQGGIWASLLNGDIAHYSQGAWQIIPNDRMPTALSHRSLYNILLDSTGTLWGAGSGGVVAYKDGQFKLLGEKNGLPCTFTYSLIMDLHGALWLYSQCGITRIASTELQRFWEHPESKIQVESFGRLDGAQPGPASAHPGTARSLDGRLWFANNVGLQMIDPDHFDKNSDAPPLHIEQLVADHKNYPLSDNTSLPALSRDIEIDYTALSFVMPQRVAFRYILEGRDRNWQDAGTRRQAFYSDLRPGAYRFRVTACNNDGVWNETGTSLEFSVLPAYYQTTWFRALCIFGLLVLFLGIYQLRVQQLHRQFAIALDARVNERTRIARELHDTLLQNFHGLMFQFQAASNLMLRKPEDAKRSLDDAINETKKAIAESREAIQGLRSEPIAKGNLAELLMSASRDLVNSHELEYSPAFDLIEEGDRRTLSTTVSSDICRIALELVRNAYHHSNARRIEAEIRYGDHVFRLRVRDDGKGIDPTVIKEGGRTGHWGLRGIRERADQIGARLDLWSEPGGGTEVQLVVPSEIAYEDRHKVKSRA